MAIEFIEIKDYNGVSRSVAVDAITGGYVQLLKNSFAADGTDPTMVAQAAPLPVQQSYGSAKVTLETIGASQVQIVSTPLTGRRMVKLYADPANTAVIYFRFTTGVTSSNGVPLYAGMVTEEPVISTQNLYAISTAAGQKLWVREYAP